MKNNLCQTILLLVAAAVLVAACGPQPTPTPPAGETPPGSLLFGQATVDGIDILILESFPVQINVIARGNLPDGCTQIDAITQERTDNTFKVTITTARPAAAACTEALVPFEETISLDVYGLPAGSYTVDVNGVSGSFELTMDNALLDESIFPILSWHREGGIAGFCDDVLVYASGEVHTAGCQGGAAQVTRQGTLSAAQFEQLQAWLDLYAPFELEQTDPATADAMTIRLVFSGTGAAAPTDRDKQAILDFAAGLYAEYSSEE